ncbi:signal peptidase I [Chloroflexota bacterium]
MLNNYMGPVTEPVVNDNAPEEQRSSGIWRFFLDLVETLVLSALLFVGINAVSARIRVDGFSMEPTLHTGEFVIVNRLAFTFGEPSIGDVIVFHYPRDPEQEYIKRVIGLPGDTVRVAQGQVYVNNQHLSEPYIAASPTYDSTWSVPENALFVLGDNRNNSSDSHNWGAVPMEYVIGKALLVYWPPDQWGLIDHPAVASAAQ